VKSGNIVRLRRGLKASAGQISCHSEQSEKSFVIAGVGGKILRFAQDDTKAGKAVSGKAALTARKRRHFAFHFSLSTFHFDPYIILQIGSCQAQLLLLQ
jgi:hypothetical protein